ncbi:hypothetical protein [Stieleria varia]|uniref:Zinc-ribbon domain-containing protein n=1 Tax=Stieleria varia TaxID=2528005 RepID=A0A5C6A1N0_9BACT|nr:hypothetical protein [Stieleria varia]TWT93752.1 hypothetical protein Pla52n_55800 [Stieleria varia]
MTNPYEPTATTTDTPPPEPKSAWKVTTGLIGWCFAGLVYLVIGWPVAAALAFFYSFNRKGLAEKEALEANVRACPNCQREIGANSRICPRCMTRFENSI